MQPLISWIDGVSFIRRSARHLVCATGHNPPNQSFHGPVITYKLTGKVIEQFRMSRRLSQDTKIIDGWDDSASKQMVPYSIDCHPR